MVKAGFWKGRRVFVTGHTGFKGSWICLWLQKLGAEVTGFALPPRTDPNIFEAARVEQGMKSIEGDIRDLSLIGRSLAESHPEIVIHMAAQAIVRKSYQDPVETYSTNIMGTVNVLESIRQAGGVKAAVIVSSDKCYENREWCWGYREEDPVGGFDPYSSSKGCVELITSAYRRSFFASQNGTSLASVRAGNVIGGGDWSEDRLIPDILRSIYANEAPLIRFPRAVRPWQHVLEPLSGYLILCERMYEYGSEFSGSWNFGPPDQDAKSVEWIVSQICSLWGKEAHYENDRGDKPHEANYLKLDSSKARLKLGWTSRLSLEESLCYVVAWYKHFLEDPQTIREMTESQIKQYEEALH